MQHEDWKAWRAMGLGASDSPIIMGISPYKTRFQLWLEKTGQAQSSDGNWATRRGHELEPKARSQYELENNRDMPPAFLEHKEFPFIRASLDGYGDNIVLEIKCPGAEDHALALAGKVPEKYFPQLQHQLLVTGARECHYYSFDGEKGALVQVGHDLDYQGKLLEKLKEFWQLVQTNTPPELVDRDYKDVEDSAVKFMVMQWLSAKEAADSAKELQDELAAKITAQLKDHPRWRHAGVKIQYIKRKGNVDYKKIPELTGIDLDKYRGKSSSFWQLSAPKVSEVLES